MRETLKRLTKMTAGYGMVQWAGPIVSLIFTPIIHALPDTERLWYCRIYAHYCVGDNYHCIDWHPPSAYYSLQ